MALIRVVPYGQPIRPEYLLDLGPAHARLANGGSMGCQIEAPVVIRPLQRRRTSDHYRAAALLRHERAAGDPRCGYVMSTGAPCARGVHDSDDHRSAEAIERGRQRRNARRREARRAM
jgi:hypothetical protein